MSTAVQKTDHREEFTQRYAALLRHYGLEGRKIQADKANENGDVEQGHHRLKRALEQALLMRGSREFQSREEYAGFVRQLFAQLDAGRRKHLAEEMAVLRRLPPKRLDACKREKSRVGKSSTIHVGHNTYSVPSRLIGERVDVRLYVEHVEVWYGQKRVETLPRLRGEKRHAIHYRHVIGWLVRTRSARACAA